MIYAARNISVAINRSPEDVYEYASNPGNISQWAAGLANADLTRSGDEWTANSPMGVVKIKFTEKNVYGILDHDVTLPSGEINNNPFRVVTNGDGSEVIFTVYHRPPRTSEEFEEDCSQVQNDLLKLKSILEK